MTVLLGLTLVTLTVYGAYRLTRQVCDTPPTLQDPPRIEYARPGEEGAQEVVDQLFACIAHAERRTVGDVWVGRIQKEQP